jgi:hypothetical protein
MRTPAEILRFDNQITVFSSLIPITRCSLNSMSLLLPSWSTKLLQPRYMKEQHLAQPVSSSTFRNLPLLMPSTRKMLRICKIAPTTGKDRLCVLQPVHQIYSNCDHNSDRSQNNCRDELDHSLSVSSRFDSNANGDFYAASCDRLFNLQHGIYSIPNCGQLSYPRR